MSGLGREKRVHEGEEIDSTLEKRVKIDSRATNGGGTAEAFAQPGEESESTCLLETVNKMEQHQKNNSIQQSTNYSDSKVHYNGLRNQGSTCYLNSVLQVLFMARDFREAVEKHCHENPHTVHIDSELNVLFDALKSCTTETHAITRRLGIQTVYKQQDAAEYFEKIMNNSSLDASQIFHGKLIHSIVCCDCKKSTDTEGGFWSLQLAIKDALNYSVVDGLKAFFSPSRVFGDNQLYCDGCDAKADASFECKMEEHPEMLMLLLKRFEFDYRTMTYIKIQSCVEVPYTIQLPANQLYEIFAIVDHMGSLKGGHYTTTIKSQDNGRWYQFNDTRVWPMDMPVAGIKKSDTAYLLTYRKMKMNAPDTPIPLKKEQSVDEPQLKGWDGDVNDREREREKEIEMGEMKEAPETLESVKAETGDGAVGSVEDKKAEGGVEMPSREGDASLGSVRPEEGPLDSDQDKGVRTATDLRQSSDNDKEESGGEVNDVRVDKEEGGEDEQTKVEQNEAVSTKPQVEDSNVGLKEAQGKTGDVCSQSCKDSEGIEKGTRCDNVKEETEGGATKDGRSFVVVCKEKEEKISPTGVLETSEEVTEIGVVKILSEEEAVKIGRGVKGKYLPHTEVQPLLKGFSNLNLESGGEHHGVQTSSAALGDDGRRMAKKSSRGKNLYSCFSSMRDTGDDKKSREPEDGSSNCAPQQMTKRKGEVEEKRENMNRRIEKEEKKEPKRAKKKKTQKNKKKHGCLCFSGMPE